MMDRRKAVGLLAGTALVAAGGYFGLRYWNGQKTLATTPIAPSAASNTVPVPPAADVPELVLGSADAKVTLVEYASYTCPHCANFHETVFKALKKDYIDTGKVKFVYREVYFDRPGLWAALLARCSGETRYFGINGILLEKQREWVASDDPKVVIGNLRQIGRTAGMSDADLDACFKNETMLEDMMKVSEANIAKDNIQGTPTLMINGVKHSNMSYDDLKTILDAELAK